MENMEKLIQIIQKRRLLGFSDDAIAGQLWEEGYETKEITKAMDTLGPPKSRAPSFKIPSILFLGIAGVALYYGFKRK